MSADPVAARIEAVSTEKSSVVASSRLEAWKTVLELVAKLLPGTIFFIALIFFRHEVSFFLKNASKVEAFGFKLEKGEFDKRLQGAAESLKGVKDSPAWTDIPFRKLRLAAPLLKGAQILWVDDHPENNFYLRRILTDIGVEITIAINNAEGLDAIKRKDYFLIISDFNRSPPLTEDGGELAIKVQQLRYEAPFIFYSGDPSKIPNTVPLYSKTNDPSVLLSLISELSFDRASSLK